MKIINILQTCKGKEAAMLGAKIATLTGISYYDVRQTISHLINQHGCLIGSYSRGYYQIVDPKEVDEVCESLRHRGILILYRASRIKKQSLEDVFNQGRIEFKE
ncbi:MAG: hypothetical protein HZB61_10185 [Nitrospirae bacterium]|nr:hypothetical protein [Nitrospirota bacterium]